MILRALDLFSCIGCHAIGFHNAGIETAAFVEINPFRRAVLRARFPGIQIHDDVRTFQGIPADVLVGGPPCQNTSVASAVHGKRTGASLWRDMLRLGINAGAEWTVVEQPTGNPEWETDVSSGLARLGWHVARFEFEARNIGAPFQRRRVFLIACTSLSRLEVAWAAGPRAIEEVARAADARGTWNPDQLATLRVDARSAGEMERSESRIRRERIEALGDSNPPGMMEVIGRMIVAAHKDPHHAQP